MRTLILKKGKFFGNDDDSSNEVARLLYRTFYEFLKDRKNLFGYHWLIGDLVGYNEHHKWFGEKTKATPDGRYAGDRIKFGLGQRDGRDKNGLTALLNAIAGVDPHAIACGSTVTNISIDEQLIRNDANFEKTVDLFETYFKNGGVHFQLTYVSREDLICAKQTPDAYQNLRVRVTGFSDYFTRLQESMQDDIIERTTH
jgi:formate C-acetyltransferase